jgi:glutamine amidotransferase
MILIIDYGLCNLRSVQKAFERIDTDAFISADPHDISKADKLLLPGVGSFARGMENLSKLGWVQPLREAVENKKMPLLGICLGMQLLTDHSEEGNANGFGWIKGHTSHFSSLIGSGAQKIPHMGWNSLEIVQDHPLLKGIDTSDSFYFVHSYYVKASNRENQLAHVEYGKSFDAAIFNDNIFGVQFHPEKSHTAGLNLLKNFSKL